MRKLYAVLLVCTLLFCLAACGSTGGDPADTTAEAETPADASSVPAPTKAASDDATSDIALIGEIKTQLVGSWHFYAYDGVKLTFRDNGTGSYLGLDGSERSFLYFATIVRGTFNNGAEYTYNMLKVEYDNGVSEDIVVDFREENGTKLILHSFESDGYSGGYSGVIDFDEWTKDS